MDFGGAPDAWRGCTCSGFALAMKASMVRASVAVALGKQVDVAEAAGDCVVAGAAGGGVFLKAEDLVGGDTEDLWRA